MVLVWMRLLAFSALLLEIVERALEVLSSGWACDERENEISKRRVMLRKDFIERRICDIMAEKHQRKTDYGNEISARLYRKHIAVINSRTEE